MKKNGNNYYMYFKLKHTSTNSSEFNRSVILSLQVKHKKKKKITKVKLLCVGIIL